MTRTTESTKEKQSEPGKTYTPRRAPARLPRLKHHHAPPAGNQLPGGKCTCDAAAHDHNVSRRWKTLGCAMAQQLPGWVAMPVRERAVGRRQLGLPVLRRNVGHVDDFWPTIVFGRGH